MYVLLIYSMFFVNFAFTGASINRLSVSEEKNNPVEITCPVTLVGKSLT
jgi:hypothetical protein